MEFTTAQEKKEAFHKELKQLLAKYDAELTVRSGEGYNDLIIIEFGYDQEIADDDYVGVLCLGRHESGRE